MQSLFNMCIYLIEKSLFVEKYMTHKQYDFISSCPQMSVVKQTDIPIRLLKPILNGSKTKIKVIAWLLSTLIWNPLYDTRQ